MLIQPPNLLIHWKERMPKKCSYDGRRGPTGVATSYWRWFIEQDVSVGYRLYTCFDCTVELVQRLGHAADPLFNVSNDPTCVACHSVWQEGDPTVWGYFYAPKTERVDYEATLCPGCLDKWVEPIRLHGQILVDRDQSARARDDNPWGVLIPTR